MLLRIALEKSWLILHLGYEEQEQRNLKNENESCTTRCSIYQSIPHPPRYHPIQHGIQHGWHPANPIRPTYI